MNCIIEYVGKLRTGTPQYYCLVHKFLASDKKGNKLEECLCEYKALYDNRINLKEKRVESIKIIYTNVLKDTVPRILINNEEFNGVIENDGSVLCYKDLGGIMLSKLNNISLELAKCSHCGHYHSDNGKFAYTPHRMHLCSYCGHLFRVKEKNVGSELNFIYNIPCIELNDDLIPIEDVCSIEYDLLKGSFLINNKSGNRILLEGKEIDIVKFLNDTLKNEF